jgi:hypothetical protein
MVRSSLLAAAAFMSLAGPALAGGRCSQPYAPVIKINASLTKEDLASLRDDVTSFIAASDIYQTCLIAESRSGVPTDSLIDANQAQKERVGQQFNAAVHAFKSTHPG